MPSKPEIEGEKILNMLLGQRQEYGGAFAYITGSMGGGKTSAMFFILSYTLNAYKNQKIFLSETYDAPLQAFKLGIEKIHFMVKEGEDVVFRDRNKHLELIDVGPTYFKDYEDLYNKAKPGYINVPFFGDRTKWMEFIAYLRHTGEWSHVFIDEIGEVVPSNTSGKLHKRIGQFSIFIKDIRKCKMKVVANTQSVRDMDWRLLEKFMFRIFLPGAMADRKHSRVTQPAIDNLEGNETHGNDAYIDRLGRFGIITFTDIFKPNENYSIEAHIISQKEYHVIPEEEEEEEDGS